MLTFDATEQINEVSRTTTQVITRYFGRWPQTKMDQPRPLFSLFSSFQQLTENIFNIKFSDDCIRTTDLWYWK